ncbi:hypothetical protein [Methylobacterium gnaphalii]|uniref:Uncharacterized protein n=1 Tax=Methylobacterium gnaphalii TaxID=1010610 RepID=A0A512JIM1_9HYPH|nr:hypothetical protein [Methylobacterium gnaphalii]GEP09797.1 hypothetical protein MGN01_16420 [Methylobacterium gnaphalii]GJD67288.1 hypothetical protein MMMDOFMJ_0202 [Methylobacterium gnaphalii]
MTNITAIQPREIHFRTATNSDWLDGLGVWQAGQGGIVAGAANAGNGSLIIDAVAPQAVTGHYILSITSIEGVPRYTIEHPNGVLTPGVVGLPLNAGGIGLTLTSASGVGAKPFEIGDTFAIAILPAPIDITGIAFTLQARLTRTTANVALAATSSPTDGSMPTIAVGTTGGQVAMVVPKTLMARDRLPPNTYVYDILATAEGRTVTAFYGTIEHVDGVVFLP